MKNKKRKVAGRIDLSKDYWQLPCPTCGFIWNVYEIVKTPFPDDKCIKCRGCDEL